MRATAVGPDLSRSTARVDRPKNTGSNSDDAAERKAEESDDEAEAAEADQTVDAKDLPMSA
jgi:single-strand DNA-binding protein